MSLNHTGAYKFYLTEKNILKHIFWSIVVKFENSKMVKVQYILIIMYFYPQ